MLDEDHDGNINLEELGEVRQRINNNVIKGGTSAQQISTDPIYVIGPRTNYSGSV